MKITAQQARETKIFVINNYNNTIEETTLFDHVVESAEETTSPRGIEYKMFTREVLGIIFKQIGTDKCITEKEYDALSEDAQNEYNYFGEAPIAYDLCEWMVNGKVRILDTFETEQEAENEWFRRTYEYDFLSDDQRDTNYWNTREEAEAELAIRHNNFDCGFNPNED